MPCCSQYLVSRNVPHGVDGGERAAGTVRGYKLVSQFCLAGDNAVDLIVDMHLVQEVLADMTKQFMQICVVVVDVARIWRMVVVLFQDGEGDTAVDAQRIDRHKALVAGLLLDYRELTIAEVLRTDAYQVGVSLTEITTKDEHVAHSFQCLYLVTAQF